MEIRIIKDKELWEAFLLRCQEKTFLQAWHWGEFNKKIGDKIFRLGVYEGSELIGSSLVVKVRAKRGSFLFLPHGPNVSDPLLMGKVLQALFKKLKILGKEEKADFIRIAPVWKREGNIIDVFRELGFRKAPIHIHPELTWELNIAEQESKLLTAMRKTTRYLIRKGEKNKDIKIVKGVNPRDIKNFHSLYHITKDRHDFIPFSMEYLSEEIEEFSKDNQITIISGEYRGETVSSGIFVFWQGIGFYHHGASSLKYPKVPVSYLVLWEAIKEAKIRGCKSFNFWGVAPQKSKNHPWFGLSLFKQGFGGCYKYYVETQDLPLSSRYWFAFLVEKIRKMKRGL